MSFEDLKKGELLDAARHFLTEDDYNVSDTKAVLVQTLESNGVTFEMYRRAFPEQEVVPLTEVTDEEVEAGFEEESDPIVLIQKSPNGNLPVATVQEDDEVLVKMERVNPRFDTHGYTFRREHPFQLVPKDVATKIIAADRGFRLASAEEAKDYYG